MAICIIFSFLFSLITRIHNQCYTQISKCEEKKKRLQDEVVEITNMSATDIWLKDLDVLESALNEFLKSGKVSGNDHQPSHNNNKEKSGRSVKTSTTPEKNKGKHKIVQNTIIDVDTCSKINDIESDKLSKENQTPIEGEGKF